MKKTIKSFSILAAGSVFLMILSSVSWGAVFSTPSGPAPSIEEAKKEGRALYYTAMNVALANDLVKAFNKKYPFIKVDIFRLGGESLLSKILLEAQAGRLQADVIQLSDFRAYVLKQKKLLFKYISAEYQNIREEFRDEDGLGTIYFNSNVIGYNTKMVLPQDVPKSYEALLAAKWKGKIGMDINDVKWFVGQLQIMGEEKGRDYMRRLSQHDIHGTRAGTTVLGQLMAAGEFPIAVNIYGSAVEDLKREGAPIDWVAVQPVLATPQLIGVSALAQHPNAAKLLVDFALSQEGAEVLRAAKKMSPRKNFEADPPRLTKGLKFFPLPVELAEKYPYYDKLYRDIFYSK
jgi:iron(III) transport system substrate-binding protein